METKPATRYPVELDITFKQNYGRLEETGTLKNVSISGAFLENSTVKFKPKDRLTLTLNLSGRARCVSATVIWHNQRGCGVQFTNFSNQDFQIVDDLIYFLDSKRETRKVVLQNIFKKIT